MISELQRSDVSPMHKRKIIINLYIYLFEFYKYLQLARWQQSNFHSYFSFVKFSCFQHTQWGNLWVNWKVLKFLDSSVWGIIILSEEVLPLPFQKYFASLFNRGSSGRNKFDPLWDFFLFTVDSFSEGVQNTGKQTLWKWQWCLLCHDDETVYTVYQLPLN